MSLSFRTVKSLCALTLLVGLAKADMDKKPQLSDEPPEVAPVVKGDPLPARWLTSWDEAKKLAQHHKVPLLIHFEATWCGACRRMEASVLQKSDVTAKLKDGVVGVRIDADRHKDLIREYSIGTLPTEVVVRPDGSKRRMTGAVTLSTYMSRLKRIRSEGADKPESDDSAEKVSAAEDSAEASVRSCLIVRKDGKMVGLGGFSPVALVTDRKWIQGSNEIIVRHEGVDYFLQTEGERKLFEDAPEKYIPRLHGCDVVELHRQNRATAGSIEYGAFYKGEVFFFASVENRDRFEDHPTWYLDAMANAKTEMETRFPFLN
ncbi:MAG TPA: hypothetical protein DCG12_21465 [Planctomycetaceae bacterium]|nr:hypothetical protein [Planctomycetaceae bacterium]